MTVELKPKSNACNLTCGYCYQDPMRMAGENDSEYDLDLMLDKAEEKGEAFSMFGGEPLLLPKDELEYIWKRGYEDHGRNSVQTNATLIDEDHLDLMEKYNVSVGVSVDGPGELNDLRWAGSLEKTRKNTERSLENIKRITGRDIPMSLIVTIHKLNAGSTDRLNRLKDFILWLDDLGVQQGNAHFYEVDTDRAQQYALDSEKNAEVFLELAEFLEDHPQLRWNPFNDIVDLLKGDDTDALCVWGKCDPMTTSAVHGIAGDGSVRNCGMTNKEGIDWLKGESRGFERYVSLYQTPQDKGGCKDCRFWLMCSGQCPGKSKPSKSGEKEGDRGDWRNKTTYCYTIKSLFKYYEKRLEDLGITPLSKSEDREAVEEYLMKHLKQGRRASFDEAKKAVSDSSNTSQRSAPEWEPVSDSESRDPSPAESEPQWEPVN